jgi:hypothetical protein
MSIHLSLLAVKQLTGLPILEPITKCPIMK